jgi:hypothetical protein
MCHSEKTAFGGRIYSISPYSRWGDCSTDSGILAELFLISQLPRLESKELAIDESNKLDGPP